MIDHVCQSQKVTRNARTHLLSLRMKYPLPLGPSFVVKALSAHLQMGREHGRRQTKHPHPHLLTPASRSNGNVSQKRGYRSCILRAGDQARPPLRPPLFQRPAVTSASAKWKVQPDAARCPAWGSWYPAGKLCRGLMSPTGHTA